LRIAKFCKKIGIKVYYYISPQVWAWKSGRVKDIKKTVDKMFVILPFEKAFYKNYNHEVSFVGHPLLDAIKNLPLVDKKEFYDKHGLEDKPIIALLPGSRKQEIAKMLKIMTSISASFKEYQFVVAGAPSIEKSYYDGLVKSKAKVVLNETYKLLRFSDAALVTSGTATLETALFKVPEIVCYKGNRISYEIAKRLVKHIKFISLVNLIMDKELVKELIQDQLTTKNLENELRLILSDQKQIEIKKGYDELATKLGGEGASDRTAQQIFSDLVSSQ
jgi:lipid-A-disaccharide synthase